MGAGCLDALPRDPRVDIRFADADQAFVLAHDRDVHGLGVQALRRIQLKRAVDAQHVDGADLRHHQKEMDRP